MPHPRVTLTHAEWEAEAKRRYTSMDQIAFVCPVCKHRQTVADFVAAGDTTMRKAGFSCIGRLLPSSQTSDAFSGKPGPCSYAGGGLFRLNPILVTLDNGSTFEAFDFADEPLLVSVERVITAPVGRLVEWPAELLEEYGVDSHGDPEASR